MKAVRFAFDDLDLVIDPFDFAGVDRVIAVVQNAVAIAAQHLDKPGHRRVF